MGTLRERPHQLRESAILDAMRDLMAARGYAAPSMDKLAAHLGISKSDGARLVGLSNRLLRFFYGTRINRYNSKFTIDGTPASPQHRALGLIA